MLIPVKKKCTREQCMTDEMSFVFRSKISTNMLVICQCIKTHDYLFFFVFFF